MRATHLLSALLAGLALSAHGGPIRMITGHSGWYIAEVDLTAGNIRVEAAVANNGAGGYQTVPGIAAARGADLAIVSDYSSLNDASCGGVCCVKAYNANGSRACAESLIWVQGQERSNFDWVQSPQYRTAIGFGSGNQAWVGRASDLPGDRKHNVVSGGPLWKRDGTWYWNLVDRGYDVLFTGPYDEVFGSSARNWNVARTLSTIGFNSDKTKMYFITSYVNKTPTDMMNKLNELGVATAMRCDSGGSASFYASSKVDGTSGISYGSRGLPVALLVFVTDSGGGDCDGSDGAAYVSESAPYDGDTVQAGSTFTKRWTMRNTGSSTWSRDCNIKFAWDGGERFSAVEYTDLNEGETVAPNQTRDITLTLRAPDQPGLYRGYWRMDRYGTGRFGDRVWVEVNVTGTADPCSGTDGAAYVSESAPFDGDTVEAGQTFTKSWTLRNTGTATWTRDCNIKLAWDGDERFNAIEYSDLGSGEAIGPGLTKTWTLTMTAPSTPGLYRGYWRMDRYGTGRFGDRVWVEVSVVAPPDSCDGSDGAEYVAEGGLADGSVLQPGEAFTKSWTLENTGSSAWTRDCQFKLAHESGPRDGAAEYHDLGSDERIPPGGTKTWSLSMTAPATAGVYRSQWRMDRYGTGRFGDAVWVEFEVADPCEAGTDDAGFAGEGPPYDGAVMAPGEAFVKTWTLTNRGTRAWSADCGHRFEPTDPNGFGGEAAVVLGPGETVQPGGVRTFAASLTAPATTGLHRATWRLTRNGAPFGDPVWVEVLVSEPAAETDGFDFPLDPVDGSSGRPPATADYNANNPYLTQLSGCYGVPLSTCQHAGEDWFRAAHAEVYAVANGRVIYARGANYPGAVVVIEHTLPAGQATPWGDRRIHSQYGHLAETDLIPEGATVVRGQRIGRLYDWGGNTHLHVELRQYASMNDAPAQVGDCGFCPSWYGPGYTPPGCHPDLFGYTDPSAFIDAHRPASACSPDAHEPNDTQAAASMLAQAWGSLDATQEADDWYAIEVATPFSRIAATAEFTHAAGDIDLALHDPAGSQIAVSESITDRESVEALVTTTGRYALRLYYEDRCNPYRLSWSVTASDRDGDGMPDWWEDAYCGGPTNCSSDRDSDGDRVSDRDEWRAGTDPGRADSVLAASAEVPGSSPILRWPSVSNRLYRVLGTPSLLDPMQPVSGLMTARHDRIEWSPTNTGTREGFYGVEVWPTP